MICITTLRGVYNHRLFSVLLFRNQIYRIPLQDSIAFFNWSTFQFSIKHAIVLYTFNVFSFPAIAFITTAIKNSQAINVYILKCNSHFSTRHRHWSNQWLSCNFMVVPTVTTRPLQRKRKSNKKLLWKLRQK